MDSRWREFAVQCHDHWHKLQPGGQAEGSHRCQFRGSQDHTLDWSTITCTCTQTAETIFVPGGLLDSQLVRLDLFAQFL